ncbi:tellurium resistance protein [Desulfamplus magnetovallimortis]|uniref:Tellurium resistance protein n=1 Tax=Desulfamplus magnetovallimortis TaxID=1246637 RepID=A0A1W1HAJ1_9BACT|nr:TerD family protein [Desulfamplus magnetovallimortis]SLM29415.1 tellurium resistance protein [Desulfamplus magnetovallimortis]
MAVSLSKGGRLSLSKEAPGLSKIQIGLGWDERATDGSEYDLDASVFLLNEAGKVRSDTDFVFYNNLKAINGAVEHMGDNLTGGGDGDDEVVKINLKQMENEAPDVVKISVVVTIHEAEARKQNFGQVNNAFIRIVNQDDNKEIVRFDLTEDYSMETAMIFGEVYFKGGEWRFTAVGQGYAGGLAAACKQFGVNI